MKRHRLLKAAAVAVLAGAMIPSAASKVAAQQYDATWTCQNLGNGAMEPLGGQAGPMMSVGDYACVATSGPMAGGVDTGRAVLVFDQSGGKLMTGTGVIRKPDATAAYVVTDEKFDFVTSDGKVAGVKSIGHGRYVLATGSAASLAGRSFTIETEPAGPNQFIVNEKYE